MFVEVKAPDWQAELSEEERKQGRKELGSMSIWRRAASPRSTC